jgi:RNA polymerase sigma factor (sigma-70 family)
MDAAERRALFAAKQKAIRRAVRRFAATVDDADEIVQDTAVLVFAHDSGPPDAEHFVGWCYSVARHLALHRHRSEARALGLKECLHSLHSLSLPFVQADPERMLVAQSRLEALEQLDDAQLSLLWNRFVLEETSVEVASRLNISAMAVRMRLTRLIACVRASEKSTEPRE